MLGRPRLLLGLGDGAQPGRVRDERDVSGEQSLTDGVAERLRMMRCTSSTVFGDSALRPSVGCSIDWYSASRWAARRRRIGMRPSIGTMWRSIYRR